MMAAFTIGLLLVAAGLVLVLTPSLDPQNRLARKLGAGLVAVLMLRYLYWRVTASMPPFDLTLSGIASWFLLVVELLNCCAGMLLLHVLSGVLPISRSVEADAHPVESHPGGPPLIDMLIPTYNESAQILRRTILGARDQDYPRFRVWVCDDLRRPWLRDLAEEMGVGYLTRPDNSHGKAGNMNAALRHLFASAEPPDAIAVLDADFVATPMFLRRAAALLHDPKTAVVQTPQVFFNPDPVQHNLAGSHFIPDEQRFFFDVILSAKDAHGTAFSCGTSAVIRASALQEIGLFPTESVTEDLLLSIKLGCAGYRTVYLNERLTAGLAPEGLAEYLTQRGRWCLGTMQIMRTRWSPWSLSRVPLIIRMHTIDTFLFWCIGALMRLICLVCPLLYWWFGLAVMRTDLQGLLFNLAPYWLCSVFYLGWVSRGANIPILTEALSLLVVREALRATAVGLFGKRNQKFKVTAKGTQRDRVVIQWELLRGFVLMVALTLGGIAWRVWFGPIGDTPAGVESMNLFWSIYNVAVLGVAGLICIELPRRRQEERFVTDEISDISCGQQSGWVRFHDVSVVGCSFEMLAGAVPAHDSRIVVSIPGVGRIASTVVSIRQNLVGCSFKLEPAMHDALVLKLFSGRYLRSPSSMSPTRFFWATMVRVFH